MAVVALVGDGGGLPMGLSKEIVSWGLLVSTAGFRELRVAGVGPAVRFRLRREEVVVYNTLGWMVVVE